MLATAVQTYRDAYKGLSRSTWCLSLVMLINRSGTMVVPFMTIYATQKLHFTLTQAGIIMGLFGLGAIAGAFIGGKVTDKLGFYPVQITALLSGGLLFMVIGLLTTFLSLCIGVFILSFFNESFRPANSTAIAFYSSPENRTRSYSLNRFAINLGWSVGGALGGFLAGHNYHLLFWVDGCTNIFAALLMLKILPRVDYKKHETPHEQQSARSSPYRDKIYITFIILTIVFATCFLQLFGMQPVYLKSEWKITEQQIGLLMAENGLIIAFIEMILVHKIEGKRHNLFYITNGILCIGLAYVLLNVLPSLFIVAVFTTALITLGEIQCLPFMNSYWIGRTQPHNRGSYAALYTIAWSSAQIAAPALGSQVAQYAGFRTLWWVISIICGTVALGMFLLKRFEGRMA
ncbi:MFS transporter [Chitinophagaceae bacterium 26-R-25]|nr:MFS transporter [Chitinophagaceae bacterium 26-R-25]